jgi:hypothetical protein
MRSNRAAQLRIPPPSVVDAPEAEDYSQRMIRPVASGRVKPTTHRSTDRRGTFIERLSRQLEGERCSLVRAEFGREATRGVWILTLELPNQHVVTLRAPVAANADPLAPKVCDDIAARVIAHLSK